MTRKNLSRSHPALAAEWHPTLNGDLTPDNFYIDNRGHGRLRIWWLGKCGHTWWAQVGVRTKFKRGCSHCDRVKDPKFTSLETKFPNLAKEWHPTLNGDLRPRMVSARWSVKVWWLGECGHEWHQLVTSRAAGKGCLYCSGKKIIVGFNDLGTTHPSISQEWHPSKNGTLTPQQIGSGSLKTFWWLGSCGHEWRTSVQSMLRGSRCPICSFGRFRASEPGTLYFLHNAELKSFKVGIANRDREVDRMAIFKEQEWRVVSRWPSENGSILIHVDFFLFQWLRREKHIPIYKDERPIGEGSETEIFADSVITKQEIVSKIEEILVQAEALHATVKD